MIEIKRNAGITDKIVFEARCNDEILASAEGEITDGRLFVSRFRGDSELFDGVCRALMNYSEHNGAVSCLFAQELLESAPLKKLYGGCEISSIAELFAAKKCCDCKQRDCTACK